MSQLRALAGETVIYGMGSILPRILNFILLAPYFTRILQESSYGIHGIMYSFAALLMVIYTYRMETAFFRYGSLKEEFHSAFSTASWGVLFSSIFFTVVLISFSESIAHVLTTADDRHYVVYFAFIIFFDAISALAFAKLRLLNRPVKFASLKLLNVLINILVIVILLELLPIMQEKGSPWVPAWFQPDLKLDYIFIANLIASALIFLAIIPEYKDLERKFDTKVFQKMFRYALPLIVVGVAGVINQLIDRFLVKELLPGDVISNLSQSGIYNACVKIAVLMMLFTTAFNYAAEPFFFKNAQNKDAPDIYAKVGQAYMICSCLVFMVITLYIDIFQYLIGENFREGLGIVPLLLLAYLFLGLYYNFSIWYKVTDRTYYGAIIASIGSVITILLNFILVPDIGYYGSAIAALSCFFIMSFLAYILGKRKYPVPYPAGKMSLTLVLAILIFLVNLALRTIEPGFVQIVLMNSALLGIYLWIIYRTQKNLIKEIMGFN